MAEIPFRLILLNERRYNANTSIVSVNPYNITYSYDPAGNRHSSTNGVTLTTYSYTAANRLTLVQSTSIASGDWSVTTYAYDRAGNRTLVQSPSETTWHTWNAQAQMATVENAGGLTSFTYTADGQRLAKQSPDGAVTGFLYDHKNIMGETDDVGGDIDTMYTATTDEEYGSILSENDGDGELVHQYDGVWSTEALVDPDGEASGPYRYQAA